MFRFFIHCVTTVLMIGLLSSVAVAQQSPDTQAKYLKYAESLIARYDLDKDGKLSLEETQKMRRPPVGADANDDGFITEDELVDSLSGSSKPPTSSKDENQKSRSSSNGPSVSARSSSRGAQSDYGKYQKYVISLFGVYDRNKDGALSQEETKKMRRPPTEADVNNDGAITPAEFLGSILITRYDADKDGKLSQAELVESLKDTLSSSQDKYAKYAVSLIQQYDEDHDGKLSQDEQKKMRRPPAEADANNDGFVSRDELIGSLSGKTPSRPRETSKPDKSIDTGKNNYSKYISALLLLLFFFF